MFSHDLDDQFFAAQIAQFVQMFDRKMDDPFQFRLPDIDDPSAADVFAQSMQKFGAVMGAGLFASVR